MTTRTLWSSAAIYWFVPVTGAVSARQDLIDGTTDMAPLLPAGAVVGTVTGVAASSVGLSEFQAIAMSLLVYYPSVLLTAFGLLDAGTPGLILVTTSLIVGARSILYSLSLAPHFGRFSTAWKWTLAYFLITPVYAFSIERLETNPPASLRGYYLGAALPMWATMQGFLVVGVVFGASVPDAWRLEFVIPLVFIALVMRFLDDAPTVVAALAAGALVLAAVGLPYNLGFLVAALGGTAAGIVVKRREGS